MTPAVPLLLWIFSQKSLAGLCFLSSPVVGTIVIFGQTKMTIDSGADPRGGPGGPVPPPPFGISFFFLQKQQVFYLFNYKLLKIKFQNVSLKGLKRFSGSICISQAVPDNYWARISCYYIWWNYTKFTCNNVIVRWHTVTAAELPRDIFFIDSASFKVLGSRFTIIICLWVSNL